MNAAVRFAEACDIEKLMTIDTWLNRKNWEYKISGDQVIVLTVDGKIAGYMRYCVLWSTVPFLEIIHILPKYQKHGFSRKMVNFLTDALKARGFAALLSSSQTNEPEPQAWHIHMGFTSNGIIENIDDEGIGEVVFRLML